VIAVEHRYADKYEVQLANGEVFKAAPAIATDAISLRNYAAFGGPPDSIRAITDRVLDKITALVPAATAGQVRSAILTRPLTIAASVIGPQAVAAIGPNPDQQLLALRALAVNDLLTARRLLDSLAASRATHAPGEITMDITYQLAWLRAQVGDSATAARLLDNALRGISAAPLTMLESPVLIASLVRAMMLRSELTAKMNDQRVATFWGECRDPPLGARRA